MMGPAKDRIVIASETWPRGYKTFLYVQLNRAKKFYNLGAWTTDVQLKGKP